MKINFLKGIALVLFSMFYQFAAAQILEPVKWQFDIHENSEVVITANIDKGWHLYDMNLPEGGPYSTTFSFEKVQGAELPGSVTTSSEITKKYDNLFDMELRWFDNSAVFVQKIKITDPENFILEGNVRYMACDDESCIPPTTEDFRFTNKDLPESLKQAIGGEAKKKSNTEEPVISSPATIEPAGDRGEDVPSLIHGIDSLQISAGAVAGNDTDKSGWWEPVIPELQGYGTKGTTGNTAWWFIFISGLLWGFVAILTPCVWPIIPLTVSFFLKRSSSNRGKAVRDALTYGVSIIVIYLILGLLITALFGASALNELSTNAFFNLLFFGLLVLFAVSFFGAFEITLPSSWTTRLDRKADSTTGLISIFFMAFTLVLVSFSCTGPLIGTLLVEAASLGSIAGPALGMFGFALALSIPFALFAIFPSWLKSVPKSGGWLNSVKVVLGFLELALALKFLSVADLAYGWRILDREVFLVLWIAIFVFLGIYLLGKIKFAHDSELKSVSVPRLFLSIASFAFALYMVPGLWGAPLKAISAFPPPLYTQDFNLYDGEVHPKYLNYESGMEFAAAENKPVLIDFTGFGCVNCREMEAAVWSDPRVKTIIDNEYILISLYVDDKKSLATPIEIEEFGKKRVLRTVGDKWSYLQRSKFGANAQPFYVVLDNNGFPVGPSYAYDKKVENFLTYLRNGLEEYKKIKR